MKYYVNSEGVYLYATDSEPPDGGIAVEPPEASDQVWLFPGWSESFINSGVREDQWREQQMLRVANQLLMLEDKDPKAEVGIESQWREYRITLRGWVKGNPAFPDQSKRPIAPV